MATSVEIVVPVLNEEKDLPVATERLHQFLSGNLSGYDWRILIADNGSTDSTLDIAKRLSSDYCQVGYLHLDQRGRGRALQKAWMESGADIRAYMDVDLSTDLSALPKLVSAIASEGYDIAIGSRLKRDATVIGRHPHREFISRAYSLLVRGMFFLGILDYQCGFKAISRKTAWELVPLVRDTGWFFDSELLILAAKNGYRIKELPVLWTDDPDSRVRIVSTAYRDLKGLLRLRFGGLRKASQFLGGRRHIG